MINKKWNPVAFKRRFFGKRYNYKCQWYENVIVSFLCPEIRRIHERKESNTKQLHFEQYSKGMCEKAINKRINCPIKNIINSTSLHMIYILWYMDILHYTTTKCKNKWPCSIRKW